MLAGNTNIIKQATFNLQYNKKADGLALQREISDWCNTRLLPQLQHTMGKYEDLQEVIKLDELNIEIELDDNGDWQSILLKQISSRLEESLNAKIVVAGNGITAQQKSIDDKFTEELIYFLKNGHLPWTSNFKTGSSFIEKMLEWLKTGLTRSQKKMLINALHDKPAQERIIAHLPGIFFYVFVAEVFENAPHMLKQLQGTTALIAEHRTEKEKKSITQIMNWILLRELVASKGTVELISLYTAFIRYLVVENICSLQELRVIEQPVYVKELIEQLTMMLPAKKNAKIKLKNTNKLEVNDTAISKTTAASLIETKDSIYINNAGLVITAAFLPALFENLQMLQNGKIKDEAVAVKLLHFIVTGKETAAEFELVLPKLLCGLPMTRQVNIDAKLDKHLKKEANEMLLSVIEHWNILKDTSVAGLRESFLQREGKLSFKNEEWLLQVEQKAYDMLLQQLPWNISLVRFPWSQYLLRTEWISF